MKEVLPQTPFQNFLSLTLMRLTERMVEEIVSDMVERLILKKLIRLKVSREELFSRIKEIFIADLKVEDELNEEVKRLLAAHPEELKGVDYQRMFDLIKKRLIRERGLII